MALTPSNLIPIVLIEGVLVLAAVALFIAGVLTIYLFLAAVVVVSLIATFLILNNRRTD